MVAGSSVEQVKEVLRKLGVKTEVVEFPVSTRTASQAASALGTTLGQIVKSLVFVAEEVPLLVLVSGANRVDLQKLGRIVSREVRKADADEVKEITGFSIGAVPPVAQRRALSVYVDEDLLQYSEVFAAAGSPCAVFGVTPQELVGISRGKVINLKQN